jgi:hypothetical protein
MPRFLSLAALALIAAPALAADPPAPAAAPLPDNRIVTAAQLKSVTDYFADKGVKFDRSASTSGNPILIEKDDAFRVSFFCGVGEQACGGQTLNTLIMWACDDSAATRTIERANAVNQGKVFGRSYIAADGRACVEQEVVTGTGGITYDLMNIYYAGFTTMRTSLPQYYQ